MGCLAGGAIVQTLGAEMTASNWKWLFDRWAQIAQQLTTMNCTGSFGCDCPNTTALEELLGRRPLEVVLPSDVPQAVSTSLSGRI